jgi:hypothetical protein
MSEIQKKNGRPKKYASLDEAKRVRQLQIDNHNKKTTIKFFKKRIIKLIDRGYLTIDSIAEILKEIAVSRIVLACGGIKG